MDLETHSSLAALIGVGIEFYTDSEFDGILKTIERISGIEQSRLLIGVVLIGSLAAIPGLAMLLRIVFGSFFHVDREHMRRYKFMIKPIAVSFSVFFVSNLSLIRANYRYIDDMGRCFLGYKGWRRFSRYLSNYLSNYIHGSSYLADISPLTQIITCLLLAVSCVIVLYVFTRKTKYRVYDYCALVPLGLSPYFLECLSYKFDSPYMAISVLASAAPLLFAMSAKQWKRLAFTAFFGTLAVCMTYQAATGIFPMAILFLCAINWIREKWSFAETRTVLLAAAAGYALGIVCFKFILMKPADTYVSNELPVMSEFIPNLIRNYNQYLRLVRQDFPIVWQLVIAILALLFVILTLLAAKRGKFVSLLVGLATVAVTVLLMFGLYPALENPLTDTRAMYGAGAWIAFLGISAVTLADKKRFYLTKFCVILISWFFITFSFTYGNALFAQNEYTDYRIGEVANEINDLVEPNGKRELCLKGSIGYAPSIRDECRHFPILQRLIPITFQDTWLWGHAKLVNYYDLPIVYCDADEEPSTLGMPALKVTNHYTVYGDDRMIVVEIRDCSESSEALTAETVKSE